MGLPDFIQLANTFGQWVHATNNLISHVDNTSIYILASQNATPRVTTGNVSINGTMSLHSVFAVGSELFSNVGWTGAGWTQTSNTWVHTSGNMNALYFPTFTLDQHDMYMVTVSTTGATTSQLSISFAGGDWNQIGVLNGNNDPQTRTFYTQAFNSDGLLFDPDQAGDGGLWDGTITSISVKKVAPQLTMNSGVAIDGIQRPVIVDVDGRLRNTLYTNYLVADGSISDFLTANVAASEIQSYLGLTSYRSADTFLNGTQIYYGSYIADPNSDPPIHYITASASDQLVKSQIDLGVNNDSPYGSYADVQSFSLRQPGDVAGPEWKLRAVVDGWVDTVANICAASLTTRDDAVGYRSLSIKGGTGGGLYMEIPGEGELKACSSSAIVTPLHTLSVREGIIMTVSNTGIVAEKSNVAATAATGTLPYDTLNHSVLCYTVNATSNWTVNFRGNSTASLDSSMIVGQTARFAMIVPQGSTAYYASAHQIDGSSVTPKWSGGTAPTSGNINASDMYEYMITKTGSATFLVYAKQTKYA